MLDLGFHLMNALEIEITALGNGMGGRRRHNAGLCQGQAGGGFHLQPAAKLIFFVPDAAHLRAGVTGNQLDSLKFLGCELQMINAGA